MLRRSDKAAVLYKSSFPIFPPYEYTVKGGCVVQLLLVLPSNTTAGLINFIKTLLPPEGFRGGGIWGGYSGGTEFEFWRRDGLVLFGWIFVL